MLELTAFGETLPKAYHQALYLLEKCGQEVDCPDYNTKTKELSMTMVVQRPLKEPMISKCFIGDPESLEQYRMEMLDGILDFEVGKGNWDYTYHLRYQDQIGFVIDELRRNPDSRRAVMMVRDKIMDMYSDDPACLQHIQYFIRNGKLDCQVLFRSNDACKATFMNAFALIMLQKKIADELGIEVGTYTHRANSFHCYQRDYHLLEGYVDRTEDDPMAFSYKGDWDELMEEARPDILKKVEGLKTR
jgi:thymidylate synthase